MVAAAFFLFLILLKGSFASSGVWGYKGTKGTQKWGSMFMTCSGARQSPINIEQGNVKKEYWKPFNFKYYDATPSKMRIKNNGHSAQAEMDAPHAPRIAEGGLKGEYIFAQFHFHWGSESTQGSEHTIDGVRFPMELHIVHYKASYGTIEEAVKHTDGLTVLGILFEVGTTDNAAFSPIVRALENIRNTKDISDVTAKYPLSAYLPRDKESFFRYQGSLTTPTCNEVVIWTIFRERVSISERQLNAFRALFDEHHNKLVNNFRPPQQLRSRQVYVSAADCDYELKESGHYTYGDCVGFWPQYIPTCKGNRQSPINIETSDVIKEQFTPLTFRNYEDIPKSGAVVKNNGHTVQVTFKDKGHKLQIIGGGLPGEYTFAQLHFHWGSNNSKGSEHTFDNTRYALEMHLVHYRTVYGSLGKSASMPDGLAVLAILFEVSNHHNTAFNELTNALRFVKEPHTEISVDFMTPLDSFIPTNMYDFYRYKGSLTTPTCNEVVVWTVFKEKMLISEKQLEAFRDLHLYGYHSVADNFRSVQDLKGRVVTYSSPGNAAESAMLKSCSFSSAMLTLLAIILVTIPNNKI